MGRPDAPLQALTPLSSAGARMHTGIGVRDQGHHGVNMSNEHPRYTKLYMLGKLATALLGVKRTYLLQVRAEQVIQFKAGSGPPR